MLPCWQKIHTLTLPKPAMREKGKLSCYSTLAAKNLTVMLPLLPTWLLRLSQGGGCGNVIFVVYMLSILVYNLNSYVARHLNISILVLKLNIAFKLLIVHYPQIATSTLQSDILTFNLPKCF